MASWKELVASSEWGADGGLIFGAPATEDQLRGLEAEFGLQLPPDLWSFLSEANGVDNGYSCELVLPTDRIAEYTRDLRTDEVYADDPDGRPQPVNSFLVISNALGNGDLYAYAVEGVEEFRPGDIVHWDHETNERSLAAADLRAFISHGNPGIR